MIECSKKFTAPEAEVVELPNIGTDTVIPSSGLPLEEE